MNKRRLDIVGAGTVGKTLARLWNQNGVFEIGSVANRSLESSEEAVAFIGAGTTSQIDNIDVLMISSVDDALAECAAQVAESTTSHPNRWCFIAADQSLPTF
jgi:predicted dinucleotide-utilizing enzyme